jgi:hypothetical protein
MEWQDRFYPLDVFTGVEKRFEELISAGECKAVELVREEINSVGTPDLRSWIGRHRSLFVPMIAEVQLEAASIEARYPELMDPKQLHESADAYVIALAKIEKGVVVSQETSVNEKRNPKQSYFIPDVCRSLGVTCVNLLGLMRREGWKF